MTASTCKSSAFIAWTSECFARNGDGKALGFDREVMTLDEVSFVYWKQSAHLTMSSLFSPGTIRGSKEPQASQKSKLPMATIFHFSEN